jgi:hypothetical protein
VPFENRPVIEVNMIEGRRYAGSLDLRDIVMLLVLVESVATERKNIVPRAMSSGGVADILLWFECA